jgi:hypothetical protein
MRILLLAFLSVTVASAQIAGGSIVGNVLDPSGAAVAGAKVTATNASTNQVDNTTTNSVGYYEFPLLPAGRYLISVEHAGFQTAKSAVFSLNSGTRPRIDLNLRVGAVSETVEVVSAAPLVNATTTELGNVIENRKIEALPLNGRNFEQLLNLMAGVVDAPSSAVGGRGGIEFNGSPAFGNNLLLDGVDMTFGENNASANDKAGGGGGAGALINTVSIEALEEFKATGSAFSAEYGRATGGVVNLTTKSGTNDFHGTAFEFFRNDKLDANSYFSNSANLARPPLRWNQFGANLGGPVKRDRVFFFFNYEGAIVRRAEQIVGNVPTPALLQRVTPAIRDHLGGLPQDFTPTANPLLGLHRRNDARKNDEHTYLSRVDFQAGAHRVALRHSYNNQDFSRPNLRPANLFLFPMRFQNAAVQDSWTISPTRFNEFRLGFNRNDLDRRNTTIDTLPGWLEVAGVGLATDFQSRIWYITNTYTLADNFTFVRGRHTFKAGLEIREVRSRRTQSTNPTHFFNTLDQLVADTPNTVRLGFGNPGRPLNSTNYGFFFQDDFRISRRLQLNLGLRYEYFTPLVGQFNVKSSDPFGPFGTNTEPMWQPDRNNWGPRLGLVIDPFGNQRLVVRAGGSISFSAPQAFFYYDGSFIDPLIPFNAIFAREDVPASFSLAFPIDKSYASLVASNPSLLPRNLILGRTITDYNRADEYAGQWNLSVQGTVSPSLALQASYVGSRGVKLIGVSFPNQFLPRGGPRPRPDIGDVFFRENAGNSIYHALQLSANQRVTRGLALDLYYTFGKALSYYGADNSFGQGQSTVQDFNNIAGSYGLKESDVKHRFVGVYSYTIPVSEALRQSSLGRVVLDGWTLQGIMNWRSGLPVNVTSGVDSAGNRRVTAQRPDGVTGVSPYVRGPDELLYLDRAAFDINTPRLQQRFGNLGFNTVRGPSGFGLDAAIHKSFPIRERHRLTFRAEAFNMLNHKVLGNPVAAVNNPNFGRILGASGGRNIQLALKYQF